MKKRLIFILLLVFAFVLVGCEKPDDGPGEKAFSWAGKEVSDISLVRDKLEAEYDTDEFSLGKIYVTVEFTDGSNHEFTCDDEHFSVSDENAKKLKTPGKPRITIVCTDDAGNEVETSAFVITLVNYLKQDEAALDEASNVIIAKRNGDKIDFVIAQTGGIASAQMQFTFNTEKMQLGEVTLGDEYCNVQVENGKIFIGFARSANINVPGTVICSIAYTGDYRNSGLAIDETFENGCWSIEENVPTVVNDICYYVSRK